MFEAKRGLSYQSDIALDDISFSPDCYPSEGIKYQRITFIVLSMLKTRNSSFNS